MSGLHKWEVVGRECTRLAVPGGWLYAFSTHAPVYVPDPTAAHVVTGSEIAPKSDADEAVAILQAAGWLLAHVVDGQAALFYNDYDAAVDAADVPSIWRPARQVTGVHAICRRGDRTLAECARLIVRDAVTKGYAPDKKAALALIAQWDAK